MDHTVTHLSELFVGLLNLKDNIRSKVNQLRSSKPFFIPY